MDAHKIVVTDMQESISRALRLRILSNPRIHGDFYKNPTCISSKYTRFANQEDYLQNYHHKYEQGEYLATLQDGAFLQIHYEFERSGKRHAYLKKMNLCYLPAVDDNSMKNEYIRVDFDNTNQNSFFHPIAHVHIGFTNSIRLPMDEVFLFSEFLRWILYLYYPEDFRTYVDSSIRTSNTVDKSSEGKITKNKVLSTELEAYYYLKTLS